MYECGGARQNAPNNSGRTLSLSSPGKISPIRGTSFAPPTASQLVSIVVPVYNESANLERLWSRLKPVLDGLNRPWETVFIDDGSGDDSLRILREISANEQGRVRVVELARNFGQHSAILAGFRQSRGDVVVTLDADLQNPPEEIPRLLAAIDDGNDVVGGWREERHDYAYRKYASRLHNRLTSLIVGVPMHDYGCMLRAYRRHIVDTVVDCDEKASFVPALANTFAKRVAEIPVGHEVRAGGESKYDLFSLAKLSLNLITGFSLIPIQALSLTGVGIFVLDALFAMILLAHRLIYGPQQEGALWTLFAVLFFFVGVIFLALGLIGEYVGRIYIEVRRRPTYIVRAVHGTSGRNANAAQPAPIASVASSNGSPDAAVKSASCVLFAYHEMGYECMKALLELGVPIATLFTHRDDPQERIWWRSCAELAESRGIPVYMPDNLDAEATAKIASIRPAVIYSFYYRHLIPDSVLDLASVGAFNLHGSLLPAYRGRAPVNWMLVNGEREAGVTLHYMVARADAGDIVGQRAVAIDDSDNALTLYRKLVPLGVELITEMHPRIVTRTAPQRKQDISKGSYFGRRRPEDGRIDWRWPSRRIFNLVRAVTHPYPGAFCFADGKKLLVWDAKIAAERGSRGEPGQIVGDSGDGAIEVAAGEGSVSVRIAQFEGSAEGPARAVLGSAANDGKKLFE